MQSLFCFVQFLLYYIFILFFSFCLFCFFKICFVCVSCVCFFLFFQIFTSNIQHSHFHGELFSIRASAQEKEEGRKGGKKCFVTASGLHFKCFPLLRSVLGAGTEHVNFLTGYRTLDKHWIPQTHYIPAHLNLPFHKNRKERIKSWQNRNAVRFVLWMQGKEYLPQ